jgi:hypothetical protein
MRGPAVRAAMLAAAAQAAVEGVAVQAVPAWAWGWDCTRAAGARATMGLRLDVIKTQWVSTNLR